MSVVSEYLQTRGIEFSVLPHASAHSAVEEALTLGVGASQVAKAVVLRLPEGPGLAVLPGYRRLDQHLVKEACGDSHVALATEDEIERDFPEFELGAFPALPSLIDGPVFVDPELLEQEQIFVASGDPRESIRMAPRELFDAPNVRVQPISTHPEENDGKHLLGR